ncbi:hypothetical protein [Sphaerisporangium dianthi]|uniref:Adhesin domain-containing protein n=1 Tax=Sphaerisporangium dianthi TaxID=1436120 RepID=A0ABV9CQV8_9ACTN
MPAFDAPTPIRAIVDLAFGALRVTATGQSTSTTVQVLPTDPTSHKDVKAAERTQVDYSDGRLRITGPGYGSRAWLARAGSVEVTVDLPERSHLEARIVTGDLRVEGRLDEVRVHSAHGEVRLDRADTIYIKADSGRIVLSEVCPPSSPPTAARRGWPGTT